MPKDSQVTSLGSAGSSDGCSQLLSTQTSGLVQGGTAMTLGSHPEAVKATRGAEAGLKPREAGKH